MKLGIMQPYFFPYLGYFDLINRVDEWIVFDTAQYIRHGWVNRNRILHPKSGWQYIIVPLEKHSRETPINHIVTQPYEHWRPRMLGQLQHYKKKAPGYSTAYALVEECLSHGERNLSRLNVWTLRRTCEVLGIPFHYRLFSEMGLEGLDVKGAGDWALRISEKVGATEYLNPPGGKDLFDPAAFAASRIRLAFQEPRKFVYECPGYRWEPDLSIVDVLMWNEPDAVSAFLRQATYPSS